MDIKEIDNLMNKQRHLDQKHIGQDSSSLLNIFMSGALSPAGQTRPQGGGAEESPSTFHKKATFITESEVTVEDEESEEDDLDKLNVILKGERKQKIQEAHSLLIEKRLRKWLVKHGKAELLDF
jgi:hypothetical protein